MIYEAVCSECKKRESYSRSVLNRFDTPVCCGKKMERVYSPTMGKVDVPAVRK